MKIKIFILILLLSLVSFSQQKKYTKAELDSLPNTIENQFIKTYESAKRWNQYKMIDKQNLYVLKKSILDSVSTIKNDTKIKEQKIISLQKDIDKLNNNVTDLEKEVSEYKSIQNGKNTIKGLLFTIIGLLTLALLFFIFKFKNSNTITKSAKQNLNDLELEFEQHRKKSIEREQKLRRQLQDEINKQRGV